MNISGEITLFFAVINSYIYQEIFQKTDSLKVLNNFLQSLVKFLFSNSNCSVFHFYLYWKESSQKMFPLSFSIIFKITVRIFVMGSFFSNESDNLQHSATLSETSSRDIIKYNFKHCLFWKFQKIPEIKLARVFPLTGSLQNSYSSKLFGNFPGNRATVPKEDWTKSALLENFQNLSERLFFSITNGRVLPKICTTLFLEHQ